MISKSVVVDTNLIFSALIPKASKIRELLFDSNLTFYAPNFLISEIYKHKEKLIKNSRLDDSEFYLYFNGIIENIQFVPIDFISLDSKQKAYDLCKDIDIKDTPFIALTIDLNLQIWTGDKKIKDGLKSKGFNEFFTE
ncbi:MAG TPA: PIN domain-containing protein [Bacteroidales bacterium]|nr:PIN domain-containing protein [Bacteroidales bacterium]